MKTRLLAAMLVIAGALTISAAGQPDPRPLGRFNQFPIEVIQKDGKTQWKIAGRGEVRVEEMMIAFANATGTLVSYDDVAVQRAVFTYVAPENGALIEQDGIPMFVSELISTGMGRGGLTIAGFTESRTRICTTEDAIARARYVDAATLATINSAEWVLVRQTLERMDFLAVVRLIGPQLSDSRKGLSVQGGGTTVLIGGRADRVRGISALIRDLDKSGVSVTTPDSAVRTFEPPSGVKAADAAAVIQAHFPVQQTTVYRDSGSAITTNTPPRVTVSVTPSGSKIIAKGSPSDLAVVEALIAAMK